ncbi:MAG: thioredoxin TrxC [Azonexus sp.]
MSESLHVVCPHCTVVNRLPPSRLGEKPNCGQCGQALFTGAPVELKNAVAFDRHVGRNDLPVVVDFWAPWCGPCRTMGPNFAQACGEIEPALRFAKLNTEEVPIVAARYNIRSIPTLAIFRNGREIARQSGALDAGTLRRWLQENLNKT